MWRFLRQTVRPISFVSWIPAVVGSLITHNLGWHVLTTSLAVIVAVGLSNALNNVLDRKIDRLNPAKDTLAISRPIAALLIVLVTAPILSLLLRETGYDYALLSLLFYGSVFYSFVFSRIKIVKRLTVATLVSATAFLAADTYPLTLWLWACVVWVWVYFRETKKDMADTLEDNLRRFLSFRQLTTDWWFALAPLLGATIYLTGILMAGHQPDEGDIVLAVGVALTVLAYTLIRSRNGWYKMKIHGNAVVGIAGLSLALSGLMPPSATGLVKLLVVFNLSTIFVRSISYKSWDIRPITNVHDAWLWASLMLLVICRYQRPSLSCLLAASLVLVLVFVWEFQRLKPYRVAFPTKPP